MASAARQSSRTPWVLVVDDDPMVARATARAISSATGARVALVTDVDAALRLALRASEPPVAVVLDFELSGGSTGLSVLMSLRGSGCDAPCAFYTGAPDRARTALAANRMKDGYPVFEKGGVDGALVAWLAGFVRTAPHSSRSGTRRKITG